MDSNNKFMEEVLKILKDVQSSNLEILSRVANIEDRVTNIEEYQVTTTDRISRLEQATNQGFARIEGKLNNVIITNQMMNYTYESIKEDHNLHAKFLLSMSARIKRLEQKDKEV